MKHKGSKNGNRVMLYAGFDDTDSPAGMCTTYLAYVIAQRLCKNGSDDASRASSDMFADYPRLVRLNPNIPWKTRGNGAVAMLLHTSSPDTLKKTITDAVFEHADIKNGANPAVVFLEHDIIPDALADFSKLALWQIISRADARKLAGKLKLEHHYKGNGQGLVGAMGAIGYAWHQQDHTLELLSYRKDAMCGTPRMISEQSARRMHERTAPDTFNNYDHKKGRIIIAPRGPDPVFYGIRGERIKPLVDASCMIQSGESPVGYMVFRTNQGTGAHLQNELAGKMLRPYASGWIRGMVADVPDSGAPGGHVYFGVKTIVAQQKNHAVNLQESSLSNNIIRCAVYKPTGLARTAISLVSGDTVRIGGGIRKASGRHGRVLNVEYIQIISLVKNTRLANPACTICGKNMKSKGAGQYFECMRCKNSRAKSKVSCEIPRTIDAGLYIPDVAAQRHLTRPAQRLDVRNTVISFDPRSPWLRVYN